MATQATTVSTYADVAKRMDPNGGLAKILEILNKVNPILTDMLVMECNDGTGHRTTVRTGIPEATWRMLNYGVGMVKSRTASVRDTTGMLEIYAECDKKLAELSGNAKAYRLSEAKAIMEGMSQQMASTVFYGNVLTHPERFTGLTPRYSTLNTAVADSAENVINANDGTNTAAGQASIWLVNWGEGATHGLYPKGTKAGLHHRDLGEDTLRDADGGQYQGYRDHFEWDLGLTVRDWRRNVRIANVEVSKLNDTIYIKTLIKHLIDASERVPWVGEETVEGGARSVWYCSKAVRTALRHAILEKVANNLTWETVNGKRIMMFDEIPVHRVDALLDTEAVVS